MPAFGRSLTPDAARYRVPPPDVELVGVGQRSDSSIAWCREQFSDVGLSRGGSCGRLLVVRVRSRAGVSTVSLPVFLGVVGQAPRVVGAVGHCDGELSGVRFEFESPSSFMDSVVMEAAYR